MTTQEQWQFLLCDTENRHLCKQQARLLLCQEIPFLSKVSRCPDEINYSYCFQTIKTKQAEKNINLYCLKYQDHFGQYGGGTMDTDLGQTLFKRMFLSIK